MICAETRSFLLYISSLEYFLVNSKDIKISFSSKYMMDAIKTFDSEEIELSFNGEIKPIIINYVDNDDLTQLILPIRTY